MGTRSRYRSLALAMGLAIAGVAPVAAQSGFALKGGLVFNSSEVRGADSYDVRPSDAAGFHLGAELVLPLGIGIGVSGYTAGSASDFDASEGSLVMLGEANYFFDLPVLPVTPYAGLHVGLGTLDLRQVDGGAPQPAVDTGDLGYQVGARLRLGRMLGLDAQYRRVSYSLQDQQGPEFDNDQLLLGVTLF